jgi:hypothetical protein
MKMMRNEMLQRQMGACLFVEPTRRSSREALTVLQSGEENASLRHQLSEALESLRTLQVSQIGLHPVHS